MKQYVLIKSEGTYEDCVQRPILCSRNKELIEQEKSKLESENDSNEEFLNKWRDKYEEDIDKVIAHMYDNDEDYDLSEYAEKHPGIISIPLDVFKRFSDLQDEWCTPDEISYYIREVKEV